jgi:hypothetical protein
VAVEATAADKTSCQNNITNNDDNSKDGVRVRYSS